MFESNPIIILGVSQRSGTTLLQRLLCSSKKALIYGDPVGQEIEFLAQNAASKELIYQQSGLCDDSLRQSALSPTDDRFIASMMPQKALFFDALKNGVIHLMQACKEDAKTADRSIWGWKHTWVTPFAVRALLKWLPEARIITLRRSLEDVVRSAKAVQIVQCEAGLRNLCAKWQENNAFFDEIETQGANPVLALVYDTMLQDKRALIAQLEKFTGAHGIKSDVFSRKLNQYGSASTIKPHDLSDSELEVIRQYQPEQMLV